MNISLRLTFSLAAGGIFTDQTGSWRYLHRRDWQLAVSSPTRLAAGGIFTDETGSWRYLHRPDWQLAVSSPTRLAAGGICTDQTGSWRYLHRPDWQLAVSSGCIFTDQTVLPVSKVVRVEKMLRSTFRRSALRRGATLP